MRITAGLGRVDDYPEFCRHGVNEVFCGYVPEKWAARFGQILPLNRREVRWVPTQLGSECDLRILRGMMDDHGVPAALTFNSPYYTPASYPLLGEIIDDCLRIGFDRFIIADMGLLVWLAQQGLSRRLHIHLSGELGEINTGLLPLARRLHAERIILHRDVTVSEMAQLIAADDTLCFEAFAMNELCHFSGGYCASLHCDELAPLCRIPWRLHPDNRFPASARREITDVPGESGCALCALWDMRRAGVRWLKVVGRGAFTECMLRDIAALRTAVKICGDAPSRAAYIRDMKAQLFPDGCGGSCYPSVTGSMIE